MRIWILAALAAGLCMGGCRTMGLLPVEAITTATPAGSIPSTAWPTSPLLPTAQPLPAPATPGSGEAAPHATGSPCVPPDTKRQAAQVVNVVDGDTIDVEIDGRRYAVRYIGMDTPESTRQQEPFGQEAAERNRELVEDRTVMLVKDVSETDRYGRLLRYVFAGDVFVNDLLVREGLANAGRYPPDDACQAELFAAEAEAQAAGRGMWAGGATPIPTPPGGLCDPAYPDVCLPPPPPDLDCADVAQRRFQVRPPDPHHMDPDGDGVGCEG